MSALEKLKEYLLDKPQPLIGAETIQILLLRQVLDYTVLRTEETRELNTVTTPRSAALLDQQVERVAFLGTKQKAAETRELEAMLRSATRSVGIKTKECYLKDKACLECPRCGLFGASALGAEPNIKHRIEYSTAFSIDPAAAVSEVLTFNAVDERNQTTGQALGARHAVKPATLFASVVTLKSVTEHEFVLTLKTLLSCKSYGAETRIGGDCRNTVWGIVGGWEEIITPLELALEASDFGSDITPARLGETLEKTYRPLAGNPDRVLIAPPELVDEIVAECSRRPLGKAFLEQAYDDIRTYRQHQK